MKKYNFKRIGAAAAAAVMLTVSGCSLYPDGKSYSWERQNNGTQEATEGVSISEDMTKITGKLNGVTSADATLSISNPSKWYKYTAQLNGIDEDRANRLKEYLNYEEETEDKSFVSNREGITYTTLKAKKKSYSNYVHGQRSDGFIKNMDEVFPLTELDGFPLNDALKVTEKILDILGLNAKLYKTVAIDAENATARMNEIGEDAQIYYPSKDARRYGEGGEPVVWTRDDEAYFISYQLELDGAYLTNMYKHLTSGDVNGTRLEFVVGRDEVYWINCYRIYDIESREEITEPLKSVDDVLKRIKESNYYTIGLTEEGNMTSIELGYISYYSQQEKKMMIIPCWVCDFDITKKMVTGDKEYNESAKVMVIDAVTGQVRY